MTVVRTVILGGLSVVIKKLFGDNELVEKGKHVAFLSLVRNGREIETSMERLYSKTADSR